MEDMSDRFCELCRIFRVLTWGKLALVEHVVWMEFLVGGSFQMWQLVSRKEMRIRAY